MSKSPVPSTDFSLGAGEIGLVEHDDVGELDLVDQQASQAAIVLGGDGEAAVGQADPRPDVREEGRGIDHRDHGVEPRELAQAGAVLGLEGEGLGDG
jgi:hypothetical protein